MIYLKDTGHTIVYFREIVSYNFNVSRSMKDQFRVYYTHYITYTQYIIMIIIVVVVFLYCISEHACTIRG